MCIFIGDVHGRNSMRMAEAWMDDYKVLAIQRLAYYIVFCYYSVFITTIDLI